MREPSSMTAFSTISPGRERIDTPELLHDADVHLKSVAAWVQRRRKQGLENNMESFRGHENYSVLVVEVVTQVCTCQKFIELYTLNLCGSLYVSCTLIKLI